MAEVVVDASAFVDLLAPSELGHSVGDRLRGHTWVVPAHFDAEVLSALGRLARAGELSDRQVADRIRRLASAPLRREGLPELLAGAWRRRHNIRLVDALYVELSHRLDDADLITTDARLAAATTLATLVTLPD
jgi:predicted nucleic acid-binding protein